MGVLCRSFPRLFRVLVNKFVLVKDVYVGEGARAFCVWGCVL